MDLLLTNPISSIQANTMVANITMNDKQLFKMKINTNIIHSRFHRSDGAITTIKAHDLWIRVTGTLVLSKVHVMWNFSTIIQDSKLT